MADSTRAGTPSCSSAFCKRQRVHDGRQHAHVVGGGAVHALGGAGEAAEDVAAADHDGDLAPGADGLA